jgi:hypothetical protein
MKTTIVSNEVNNVVVQRILPLPGKPAKPAKPVAKVKAAPKTVAPIKVVKEHTSKRPRIDTTCPPKVLKETITSEREIIVLDPVNRAREGTNRRRWIDALLSSKTIGEAQAKVNRLDYCVVYYAVEAGYIGLGIVV